MPLVPLPFLYLDRYRLLGAELLAVASLGRYPPAEDPFPAVELPVAAESVDSHPARCQSHHPADHHWEEEEEESEYLELSLYVDSLVASAHQSY
jgi:hypothetical protein